MRRFQQTTDLAEWLTKAAHEQQTLFVTLDKDVGEVDEKFLTTYRRDLPGLEVFAHYQGRETLSSDIFSFSRLDTRDGSNPGSPWYGFAKGDVTGWSMGATLIMAIVSAQVSQYFGRWGQVGDPKDLWLNRLLHQISDLVEPILALPNRGLHTSLNVGIVNSVTGQLKLASDGHFTAKIWRAKKGLTEMIVPKESITLGTIPGSHHGSHITYSDYEAQLEVGDIFMDFTAGLYESRSLFRDRKWRPIAFFDTDDLTTIAKPGERRNAPIPGAPTGVTRTFQAIEEEWFRDEWLDELIGAFFGRKTYILKKQHCPIPNGAYLFDFGDCDGSARQFVLALRVVERTFRLVPDPRAMKHDCLRFTLEEDDFLRRTLKEFDHYFRPRHRIVDGNTVVYSHLKEDPQSADLTILAIRKR